MTISVGDRIPDVPLRIVTDGAPSPTTSAELLGNGRVVLFAVPGAFTPTCSRQHLPSYVESAADLSAAGVDKIVCISVNDPFVMDAWGKVEGVGEEIIMAADGNADFTAAIGAREAKPLRVKRRMVEDLVQPAVVIAFRVAVARIADEGKALRPQVGSNLMGSPRL